MVLVVKEGLADSTSAAFSKLINLPLTPVKKLYDYGPALQNYQTIYKLNILFLNISI